MSCLIWAVRFHQNSFLRSALNELLVVRRFTNTSGNRNIVSAVSYSTKQLGIASIAVIYCLFDPVYELKNAFFCITTVYDLSLIHISEPTRRTPISYAVFCLKKKNKGFSKGRR